MFGGDPFDPFGTRRQMRQMEEMMDSMMGDPFGGFFGGRGFGHPMMGMIENPGSRSRNRQPRTNENGDEIIPANAFGMGGSGGIFGNFGNLMQMMEHGATNDPNSHVFTQSTMISYDGNGAPKVVQNSVRKSGDVKETRRSFRDGEREEVTVGHAIGDREHIIEKKRGSDGRVRKNQRFVNLDEDEAEHFNTEFKTRATRNLTGLFGEEAYAGSSRHRAIEGNGRTSSHSGRSSRRTTKESQPIIEIPDDDDDDVQYIPRPNNRVTYSNNGTGPRISEVTEDDAAESSSKRRKGMFGRFFANDD